MAGVSLGMQVMLIAILLATPYPRELPRYRYTDAGNRILLPEYDIPIYLAGCALAVAAAVVLVRVRRREARARTSDQAGALAFASLVLEAPLAVATLAWCGAIFGAAGYAVMQAGGVSFGQLSLMATPPLMLLFLLWTGAGTRERAGRKIRRFLARPGARKRFLRAVTTEAAGSETDGPPGRANRRGTRMLDVLVPVVVFATIDIPQPRILAGRAYGADFLHHWDFFAAGPTFRFHGGAALGTDTYAQYGVGWAVVFNALSSVFELSYAMMMRVATLYGAIYFIGAYVLLRLWLRDAVWAAVGTTLAIALQLFQGLGTREVLWAVPSSTIMRSPIDVWFFIAILLDARAPHRRWRVVAGALAGLAVVMITDSGLHLAATFVFYVVSTAVAARVSGKGTGLRQIGRRVAAPTLAAAVVVLLGYGVASRWTVFSRAFWAGWLEPLRLYGGGISQLPLAGVDIPTLMVFFLMVGLSLVAVAWLVVRAVQGRAGSWDFLFGSIGAYGALDLLLFLGRSHPFNVYHVMVPFSLMATAVACRAWGRLRPRVRDKGTPIGPAGRAGRAATHPLTVLAAVVLALSIGSHFGYYPSWLHRIGHGAPPEGSCLIEEPRDVCHLTYAPRNEWRDMPMLVDDTRAVVAAAKRAAADGSSVAIFDDGDPILYLAADLPPWGRYSPILATILTMDQRRALLRELRERPPDYAFFAKKERWWGASGADVRRAVRAELARRFALRGHAGPFELWERRRSVERPAGSAAG